MEKEGATQATLTASDQGHLQLLSIFHYVVSGLAALFSCFPFIHLLLGLFLLVAPGSFGSGNQQPPAFVGIFFITIALVVIIIGWSFAVLIFLTGRFLGRRTHYMFCFVMACVECMFMPFGTVLGVFTLVTLLRPAVKACFIPKPSF